MSLTFLLFCIFILLLISLIIYAEWNYRKLEKLNIPIVKPSFVLGSDPQGYKKIQHLEDYARFKKYGNIYGFYEGRTPQVHICDPELIKLIYVKNYDHFTERTKIDLGNAVTNEVLDWQPEDKWRLMRSVVTPNFVSHRIKLMSECLRELCEESTKNFKSEFGQDRVKLEFRRFITDLLTKAIEKCYCGVRLENQSGENFSDLLKNLIRESSGYDIKHELVRAFPFLIKFHPTVPSEPLEVFQKLIQSLIKSRRSQDTSNSNKYDSYTQHNFVDTLIELLSKGQSPENKHLGINDTTAVALALEFFLATFDSVSTPIVFLAYYLASNPKVQEKVLEEVDTIWEKFDENLGHQAVQEMPYLNACLHETLRLVPAFFRTERMCTKDWVHKGQKISKGTSVIIPVYAVNRHPDYYTDPDAFIPERFLNGKGKPNPYAFMTFGHGFKNCVGQRWAYEMSKIIMARFLKDFRFEIRDDTEVKWKPGSSFILKFHPLFLDVVKRD